MSLHLSACCGCGASYFPARLRCHRCGGYAFEQRACPEGIVAGVSRVHRAPAGCGFSFLVDIQAGEGVSIVAAARQRPVVGARVALDQGEDGAVCLVQD